MTRKPTAEDIKALQRAVDTLRLSPDAIPEVVIEDLTAAGEGSGLLPAGEFAETLRSRPLFVLLSWALALANAGGEMIEGTGDPTGQVTPGFAGQLFHDNVTGAYYHSVGQEAGGWVLVGEIKSVVQVNITLPAAGITEG
jgi:hypothetical protein